MVLKNIIKKLFLFIILEIKLLNSIHETVDNKANKVIKTYLLKNTEINKINKNIEVNILFDNSLIIYCQNSF